MSVTEARAGGRAERIAALDYDYDLQEKVAVDACNLCGSSSWTIIAHRDRYGYRAETTACWRCGLVILNPRMSQAAYARFYDGVYRPLVSAYHGRLIDAHSIQDEQREYAEHMADFAAPFLELAGGVALPGDDGRARSRNGVERPHGRRSMLDIGGSTGVVAAHFARRFGLDAVVVDPAPAEVAVAERLGIRTITSLLEEWEPDQTYDLVALFQTVDHLLDVAAALAKLRTALAPHGLLLFDIVDFRAAYLRNWSIEQAVKIDHPYSLVQETTEALLARAGFEPVGKSYAGDHLHIAYACRRAEPMAEVLPDSSWVRAFFDEVRYVQNAPRS